MLLRLQSNGFSSMTYAPALLILPLIFTVPVSADQADDTQHSAYAGQESRQIKSLSADDIAQLRAGAGWGLAITAELNGFPGPVHLLELKEEIELSDQQISTIERLYNSMNAQAKELGEQLIEQEGKLESLFNTGTSPGSEELRRTLDEIADTRSSLRFVHLSAHLETPAILSTEQVQRYNDLRGYSATDPCENIPQGHDPEMWKQHNGCN